jgi:transposase
MGRKRHLPSTRAGFVSLVARGKSNEEIAEKLKIPCRTCRDWRMKLIQRGTLDCKAVKGRPRKLTDRARRTLKRTTQRNADLPLASIVAASGLDVCTKTARNALNDMKIHSYAQLERPLLTTIKAKTRLAWARQFGKQTQAEWRHWVYSDECSVNLFGSGRSKRLWIRSADRLLPQYVRGAVQKGGGSVMVWGSISVHGPGPLLFVEGSMNATSYSKIVKESIIPYMKQLFDSSGVIYKFVDDNAPIHRAGVIADLFEEGGVNRVWWPASSPDLNPIETVWAIIKNKLAALNPRPSSIGELIHVITSLWHEIPVTTCEKLINGMQGRCEEVVFRRGWNTSK